MTGSMKARDALAWLWWPMLLGYGCLGVAWAMALEEPFLGFNITYLSMIVLILALERACPHEPRWLAYDGQTFADIAHSLLNKGVFQGLLRVGSVVGLMAAVEVQPPGPFWPHTWPEPLQLMLGLLLVEFGMYWAHRLAHEWPLLWRFHAIHHSAPRLWVINTGRFHFVDTLVSTTFAFGMIYLCGMPEHLVFWGVAIHAFVGLLTHCNVDMRFGPLSYIFNTPELHRWHHSRDLREGNKNYGENLIFWDLVFGTYFRDQTRRPPANIGVAEPIPRTFLGQLAAPFRRWPPASEGIGETVDAESHITARAPLTSPTERDPEPTRV